MIRPFEAHGDVLHRHLLTEDRVVDAAADDLAGMEALGHQRPLRLVDGLADQVLVHQGGPVVRPHLTEHDELGILVAVARQRAAGRAVAHRTRIVRALRSAFLEVDGHQEQEVREGEVGQHAPASEQSLEVSELLGFEIGVAQCELRRRGHQSSPPALTSRDPSVTATA